MKNIKKLISMIMITMLGTVAIGCGGSSSNNSSSSAGDSEDNTASSRWEVINTSEITHKSYIGGFLNENLGITVGYAGEVHYTTDGGKTWPRGENKSYCRFGLNIVNEKVAYNCGNASHVRKTTDGGKTWVEVKNYGESEPNQCRYLKFIDDKTGWIASPIKLGYTKDGGETWSDVALPEGIDKILAIDILKNDCGYFDKGYVIGSNKVLYVTSDYGKTWKSKSINTEGFDSLVYSTNQMALKFTSENDGELFYYDDENKLRDYVTTDGGDSWQEQKIDDIHASGPLYLSNDGKYLTINDDCCTVMKVMKKK